MATDNFPKAQQTQGRLLSAAALADRPGPPASSAIPAGASRPSLGSRATQSQACPAPPGATPSCQQALTLTFFFDGTGNNLKADSHSGELSNVAKMYLAHHENAKELGRYRFYIPGIGTKFSEIGDPGGTTTGLAFGAQGQDRLDWAFRQFDEKLAHHVALAQNPTNKITGIRVAAFGFSRGATLARAFARDFQERCLNRNGDWTLRAGGYPVSFYFLGLWDTVASVGLPMSTNNTPGAQSVGLMSTATAMRNRNMTTNGVRTLAFGQPGADPAPGTFDGHGDWANPLDIPSMVNKCIHMVAGHENRNSFPLDSCRRDNRYPESVQEMVYPGVHSDVGGGYRAGEGARSPLPGQMLSLIPLRAMHGLAWEAGVPIAALSALPTDFVKQLFSVDSTSQAEFEKLKTTWAHYMSQAGYGGRGVGQMINAHMKLYYGWRFYRIAQNQGARAAGSETPDQAALREREAQWRPERQRLESEMRALEDAMNQASDEAMRASELARTNRDAHTLYGYPLDAALQNRAIAAQASAQQARERYLTAKARVDTLPSTDGQVGRNLNIYDDQLMSDAEAIRAVLSRSPGTPVRPHYQGLLEAYENEFIHRRGLRDQQIIAFFETYVHDSLAGFARDATLPSDPRVVYIGGDTKSLHARAVPESRQPSTVPA